MAVMAVMELVPLRVSYHPGGISADRAKCVSHGAERPGGQETLSFRNGGLGAELQTQEIFAH